MLHEEGPGWFPAEELRQFYDLPAEYEVSKAEKILLGFNDVRTFLLLLRNTFLSRRENLCLNLKNGTK
jgi:hypothetical protein